MNKLELASLGLALALGGLATSASAATFAHEYTSVPGANAFSTKTGPKEHFAKPDIAAVPEPASWGLILVGIGFAGGVLRRRRNPAAA